MPYHLNPHSHVKIWLSNNPEVFMNFENQTRMIVIREKNPKDTIHLVYDSSLLSEKARSELEQFCSENNFTPVDADQFKKQLQSEDEHTLYDFYKDEITHLKEGGNLGVASDILRWLSPCYLRGIYTDLDVPLDTNNLSDAVQIDAPLLLNIGSLKLLGKKEFLLTLNEYIAIADEAAAKTQIERVHKGLISKLSDYSSDYVTQTEEMLIQGSYVNRTLLGYMKNRAETMYIQKSTELKPGGHTLPSRKLRAYVNEIMTNKQKYIDFNRKSSTETEQEVIRRLRNELECQLGTIKKLFFAKEYDELKSLLAKNDDEFITFMMKKERSLYLKSIVICTTGPVEVARSMYGKSICDSDEIDRIARPVAFSHYGLHHAFQSRNVVPLHENPLNMLKYLGADVGELNDSSWLEEGISLQEKRYKLLLQQRDKLAENLPSLLSKSKRDIENHIDRLQQNLTGIWWFFGFFTNHRKEEKIKGLLAVLACFDTSNQLFNIIQFKDVLADIQAHKQEVLAGFFLKRTTKLIDDLNKLSHEAVVYRLTKDKKIRLSSEPELHETTPEPILGTPEADPEHDSKDPKDEGSLQTKERRFVNPANCNDGLFSFRPSSITVTQEFRETLAI